MSDNDTVNTRALALVGLLLLIGSGCSTPTPTAVLSTFTLGPSPTLVPTAVAGVPVVVPTPTLTGAMPAALLTGKLAYADPCVTVTDLTGTSYIPVWPPGFSARRTAEQVVIVGPRGEVFGASGEIALGGGVFEAESAAHVRDNAVNLIPACDHEPFWLVADVVR